MEFTMKLSPQGNGVHRDGYLEYEIAKLPVVQTEIDKVTFTIEVRAEEDLLQHHLNSRIPRTGAAADAFPVDELAYDPGHSFIETSVEGNGLDRFVTLNDDRGQQAALAIESGHGAYEARRKDGTVYTVGASDGTWVLHNAANLPHRGGKVKVKGKVRRKR